jgi:molybdopterin molybdotransferase
MHPVSELMEYHQFLKLVFSEIGPIASFEKITLPEAVGRVLATDFRARRSIPDFRRSNFDGYAVRAVDTAGASKSSPVKLSLSGFSKPGKPYSRALGQSECVRIFTGAALPRGADAVVMVEYTEASGGTIRVFEEVASGSRYDDVGADIRRGSLLLPRGRRIRPLDLPIIASQGVDSLKVTVRPKVLVVPTGNEVKPVGSRLKNGEIYDANSLAVAELTRKRGAIVMPLAPVRDSPQAISDILSRYSGHYHMIAFIGGSSAGAEDYIARLVAEKGKVFVHGIAISPGRPTLFGCVGKTLVLGIPGHPASSVAVTVLAAYPIVDRLSGAIEDAPCSYVRLASQPDCPKELTCLRTVRATGASATLAYRSSSQLSSFLNSDGYILTDANAAAANRDDGWVRLHFF